jgi:phospholipase C
MESRRDFLKLASLLAAGGFGQQMLPAIARAASIDPEPGSTYQDAEHIVILMQENRSFDHLYGTCAVSAATTIPVRSHSPVAIRYGCRQALQERSTRLFISISATAARPGWARCRMAG